MINIYATPFDIKSHLGDGMTQAVEKYDPFFLSMLEAVSRLIDLYTGRTFYPVISARYFNGSGSGRQWIDDLISITELAYSLDYGESYTAYQAGDYILTRSGNYNDLGSYNLVIGDIKGNNPVFASGQRSIKITGTWAYHENVNMAWTSADLLGADCNSSVTELTITDAGKLDPFRMYTQFQAGQTIKIGTELLAITNVDPADNTLTVIRGINGSTAASHSQDDAVYVWRPARIAAEACIMQSVRLVNRAWQGYADGRATPELGGQILWTKKLDQEVVAMLEPISKLM